MTRTKLHIGILILFLLFCSIALAGENTLPGKVSSLPYFESSHATAAAMLLDYWRVPQPPIPGERGRIPESADENRQIVAGASPVR